MDASDGTMGLEGVTPAVAVRVGGDGKTGVVVALGVEDCEETFPALDRRLESDQ